MTLPSMDFTHQPVKIRQVMDDGYRDGEDYNDDEDLDGVFQLGRPLLKTERLANGQLGRLPSWIGTRGRRTQYNDAEPWGHGSRR